MKPGKGAVLIVEDEPSLRGALRDNLHDEGYDVEVAATAGEARAQLARRGFDLLLLDVMLPDEDGYRLCRALRQQGVGAMVMMLTARTLEDDVVRGFEAGANDYLAKPYRLRELLARVAALVRRGRAVEAPVAQVRFGGWVLDPVRRSVTGPGGEVDLTRTEFDLLAFLLAQRDRALTRDELLDNVWGRDVVVDPRTVDNFVSNLKKKLRWSAESGFTIHTLRGVGYRMEVVRE